MTSPNEKEFTSRIHPVKERLKQVSTEANESLDNIPSEIKRRRPDSPSVPTTSTAMAQIQSTFQPKNDWKQWIPEQPPSLAEMFDEVDPVQESNTKYKSKSKIELTEKQIQEFFKDIKYDEEFTPNAKENKCEQNFPKKETKKQKCKIELPEDDLESYKNLVFGDEW